MPELPDITIYLEALEARIVGHRLERVRLNSPFLVRTFEPSLDACSGRIVQSLRRLGKRIAIGLEDDLWIVLHLMIAGRLHWKPANAKLSGKYQLAAFDFAGGSLVLTEAGTKRRAALHVERGESGLARHETGGLEVMMATCADFAQRIRAQNHTLKRTLTDPSLLSGIGNAYSDEILHRARLSPFLSSQKLTDEQIESLYRGIRAVMAEWIERLRAEANGAFPEHVTAFRSEMAVHGKFGKPCPVCGAPVQRIRYADNETNYCPGCQTNGKILADRSLSRLLKDAWPRHLDEL
jgi:formamidopyrimidine-DNA glycosylase